MPRGQATARPVLLKSGRLGRGAGKEGRVSPNCLRQQERIFRVRLGACDKLQCEIRARRHFLPLPLAGSLFLSARRLPKHTGTKVYPI